MARAPALLLVCAKGHRGDRTYFARAAVCVSTSRLHVAAFRVFRSRRSVSPLINNNACVIKMQVPRSRCESRVPERDSAEGLFIPHVQSNYLSVTFASRRRRSRSRFSVRFFFSRPFIPLALALALCSRQHREIRNVVALSQRVISLSVSPHTAWRAQCFLREIKRKFTSLRGAVLHPR